MAPATRKNITELPFFRCFHQGVLWLVRQNVFFVQLTQKKSVATAAG